MEKNTEDLRAVWKSFSTILDKASGLGEFKAERLESMVEVAGKIAGNDPIYNKLVEKTADFVAKREGEAAGAIILLKRAKQLTFDDNFQIIRLLGKATAELNKEEYRDYQIEALWLLMLAYRSAGLLWAARATCITLSASLVVEGEKASELHLSLIPTMKMWAWIALELQHIPDFLNAIQIMNGAIAALVLTEESKAKIDDDLMVLDSALGCLFLNLEEIDLYKIENVPDILEGLGLFMARSALLYIMGHLDVLRKDGSLPESESDEDVEHLFSMLISQPIAGRLHGSPLLNDGAPQILSTKILGMNVEINIGGSQHSTLVAETILGFLEAFFATIIEQKVIPHIPHIEKFRINLIESNTTAKSSFELDSMELIGTLHWSNSLSPTNSEQQGVIQKALLEIFGIILTRACVIQDIKTLLDKLFVDDGAHYRMAMVSVSCISHHRVFSQYISRIFDWQDFIKHTYKLQNKRPMLIKSENKTDQELGNTSSDSVFTEPKDHRDMNVHSVIDIHAWDQAKWKGALYVTAPDRPPCLALMFKDKDAARKIFERWQDRFSNEDKEEEIYLSLVRDLPNQNKHHYYVLITSKLPEPDKNELRKMLIITNRFNLMEPTNSVNIERFLTAYHHFGAFFLLPAVLNDTGSPEILFDLAILKRDLTIKLAKNVNEKDIESLVLIKAF